MMPSARGRSVRLVPIAGRSAASRSTPDSADRLISSFHRRTTYLFDESYLSALRGRDPNAESQLISHFSRPVQIKLRSRLRSPELVQDASQETFLRVLSYFRSGKTLDNPGSLPGFVYVTCHNVAMEFLRAHTRHDQIPERLPEPTASGLDPEGQVVSEERKAMVRRLLAELPEKDRKLIQRVFLDEEDKDAVCREFAVNRNYLRVLLHRARSRFRAALSSERAKRAAEG